jgi:hypothetical protein
MRERDEALTRRGLLFGAAGAAVAHGAGRMRLEDAQDGKLAVFCGNRPLFEYRYDRNRPKPYIHPLYLPNGDPVSVDSPKDHVHHRGLMVAWSALDGFDFWGETNPGPHGQIVHQSFENRVRNKHVEIVAINHWVADGKLRLVERRTIRTHPPLAEGIWLEWITELTAPEGASLQAGQHVYDGLGIRFIPSMDGGEILNERGTTTIEKANGEPAKWCTYFGPLSRPGETGGVAFFDHPSNPRHPTPFFVMNKPFGYMSAAPTFRSGFEMGRGEKLTFRWGVLSYVGKPDAAGFNRLFDKWGS